MSFRSMWGPVVISLALVVLSGGCRKPVYFPPDPADKAATPPGAMSAYDADLDGKIDFFTYANPAGRIDRIAYDLTGDAKPDEIIPLDAIPFAKCRHLVLMLDGFAHEVLRRHYDSGHLRMFHPPSRVVAPYPSMTDMSMQDLIGGMPTRSFEARYFDRSENRIIGGSSDYLAGKNEPYNRILNYRADTLLDVIGYIDPWAVFGKEINDAKRLFDRAETKEVLCYFVSSAGMSTRYGAQGQQRCLRRIEQFVNQVIWETRGLTKVTLLSDHGHSYTTSKRIDFERFLREKGWRPARSLHKPEDVVCVQFGLVTYAAFAALRPAELAAEITACEGVELVSYADGDSVVVLAPGGGRAVVRRKGARFKYESESGDPLKLKAILADLKPDGDGYYARDELFAATLTHTYPAPLQRIWRAHFGLVQNTPDVIASLADGYFAGMSSLAGSVNVASTHGALNYSNSVTFIMSTAGPLPDAMRSTDVPAAMKALTGSDWPSGK